MVLYMYKPIFVLVALLFINNVLTIFFPFFIEFASQLEIFNIGQVPLARRTDPIESHLHQTVIKLTHSVYKEF